MKTNLLLIAMTITLMFFAVSSSFAQSRVDAPMLLEQASHAKMIDGDLDQAASLYRQVATSATASRNNVAVALVALGETYQLQGSSEAIPTYERVVSEFADQPESFMVANAKLNNLSAPAETGSRASGAEYTVVLQELIPSKPRNPRKYDFSPDGTQLLVVAAPTSARKKNFPNLRYETYVRDTSGSVGRPLIKDAGDWEYITQARWSPDGKHIFYHFSNYLSRSEGILQFMLLNVESQKSRQLKGGFLELAKNRESSSVEWMPDSNGLIIQSKDGFRIMDLDGVEKKYFASKVNHMTRMGNVSPDGRYMLFHRVTANREDHNEMDIWQLDLQTGEASELSDDDGYEGWPVWNRDGSWIYYISGPETARNIYRRKPGSDKDPEKITTYSNASAMYPRISAKGGQLTFALMKDNHVIYVADTNKMESPRVVVRGSKAMLSPDGQSVYYIDNQPGRIGLWRVSVGGDNPQQLVVGKVLTSYTQKTLVSPDGKKIAYAQYTGDSTTLFVMPSSGGAAISLYTADGIRHLIPSWSPDGKEIMFSIDGDLMVIAANGGDAMVLASVKNWESWSLEWSPDGQSIAGFAYLEGEESNHIMVVERDTKTTTRITPKDEDQYKEGLAWHPDGDRISYMYYNTEDNNGSRIVSVKTLQISDLVDMPDPNWDYIGIWGPDMRFYFSSVERGVGNGGWGLFTFDENKSEYQKILQTPNRSVSLPSWSADGKRVAWSVETPIRQVWMMTNYE